MEEAWCIAMVVSEIGNLLEKGYTRPYIHFVCIGIIFATLLLFLLNGLDFTKMWGYWDLAAYPSDLKAFYEPSFFVWSIEGLGFLNFNSIISSTQSFILPLLFSTIFGSTIAQKIMIVLPFILSFFACHYFLRYWKFKLLPAFLGALFYSVNPLTISSFDSGAVGQLLPFAIFPLFVLYSYKLVSENRFNLKYVAILGLLTIFLVNVYTTIWLGLLVLVPLIAFYLLVKNGAFRKSLRLIPLIATLLFIFMPTIILTLDVTLTFRSTQGPDYSASSDIKYTYSELSLLNFMRLGGNKGSIQSTEYLDFNGLSSYTLLGQALASIAVISLFFLRNSQLRPYSLLVLSSAVSFVLIIGIALLLKTAPSVADGSAFLATLRNLEKLQYPLTFSLVILFTYGIELLFDKVGKRKKIFPSIVVFLLILLYNFPALDGKLGLVKTRGDTYAVENKYRELPRVLQNIDSNYKEHRLLMLPWEFRITDKNRLELPNYFGTEIGAGAYGANINEIKRVLDSIGSNSTNKYQLLALFNVQYVIVDKTFDVSMTPNWLTRTGEYVTYEDHQSWWLSGDPSYFISIFGHDPNFKLVHEDKNFVIFKNKIVSENVFKLPANERYELNDAFIPLSINLLENPSFEDGLKDWTIWPGHLIELSNDSLRAAVLHGQINWWTQMYQYVPVNASTYYRMEFSLKTHNMTDLHAKVSWYNQTQNTGQDDWAQVDYIPISYLSGSDEGKWHGVKETFLSPAGAKLARIEFLASRLFNHTDTETIVDNVSFQAANTITRGLPDSFGKVQDYERINPTFYKVQVRSERPFTLAFDQSYDPSWEAHIYKNGKEIATSHPVMLYGLINGFPISQTGNINIVIEYPGQGLFNIGLIFFGIGYVFCLVYILSPLYWNRILTPVYQWLNTKVRVKKIQPSPKYISTVSKRRFSTMPLITSIPLMTYVSKVFTSNISRSILPHILILVYIILSRSLIHNDNAGNLFISIVLSMLLVLVFICLKLDMRIPLGYASVMLVIEIILYFLKAGSFSNQILIYSLLVIGVTIYTIQFVINSRKSEVINSIRVF